MNCILQFLEQYKILIELALTIVTIVISLCALFQNNKLSKRQIEQEKKLANQQNDLQERQIKVSLYNQKDQINRALNEAFDVTGKISIIFDFTTTKDFVGDGLYTFTDLLSSFIKDVNKEELLYKLGQAKYFFSPETIAKIEIMRENLLEMITFINYFDITKGEKTGLEPEMKLSLIKKIEKSSKTVVDLKATIQGLMVKELQL